ncbi:MAG TPA: inositol monophosphatase family protein, partial [Acidimicrobiales bacterium]|nr:inositol monophosphatase family protein [Acidimicrobiales bacterium]
MSPVSSPPVSGPTGEPGRGGWSEDQELVATLNEAADAVVRALAELPDWGPAGARSGQYRSDLVADDAALAVLDGAGFGVLSEESGLHDPGRAMLVVVDPVDGSTNAARGLPFFATSLCALDSSGPRAAVVLQLPAGPRYEAVRGGGARRDGRQIRPSACRDLSRAVVGVNGWPAQHLGWRQYRVLGSAALELCAVADGSLDGFVDLSRRGLAPWDYLGALLVCTEAGARVGEGGGRELVVREASERRAVVAAGTDALLEGLLGGQRSIIRGRRHRPQGDHRGGV